MEVLTMLEWTCLLLILYFENAYGIECIEIGNCAHRFRCNEFTFNCYKENNLLSVIIVKKNSWNIRCKSKMDTFKEALLPNITISEIQDVSIKNCSLSKSSVPKILNKFSLVTLKLTNNEDDIEEDFFSNTTNLTYLDLEGNRIQLKPKLFQYTSSLNWLQLANNEIRSIPKGTFQPLQKLETLHLWKNNLSTLNEFMFEGLGQLSLLELSRNKIENISEKTFYNLTNLEVINLSSNKIKDMPSTLFLNNKKLKSIDIYENAFKLKLSDLLFANLPELEDINLENSKIDFIPKSLFENSTNLKFIFLKSNNLISVDIFPQLPNLEEINLNNNRIGHISNGLASFKKLKKLFLRNNTITEIKGNAFSDLKNLEEIDLSKNGITKIDDKAFSNNENLKFINLSRNSFSNALLQNVTGAEYIDLSYNLITQIDDVIHLGNKDHLQFLDLSSNRITKLKLMHLQPWVENLNVVLNNNSITTVENMEASLPGPGSIDLSNNPFVCDCFIFNFTRYLKRKIGINSIIFGKNLTCDDPPNMKGKLLEDLDPSLLTCPHKKLTNKNTGCPDKCSCHWRRSDTSIIIDCKNQNLTQYPQIHVKPSSKMPFNQTELNLTNNSLEMGPESNLTGYENITRLFLSYNKIKEISWLPPRLQEMHLDNNKFESIDGKILNTFNASLFTNLTLNNNSWKCDCEVYDLIKFLRLHTKQIQTEDILCFNTDNKLFDLNENNLCHEWQNVYTALLIMFFLLLLAITLALYYRYQEVIKVWLWINGYSLCCVGEEDLDREKIYDAFISYSHKDEDFVTQDLLPILEEGPNSYSICLHGRNWVPGEFIANQIVTSVMESKRTIVILSPNFLESVWGLMEFRTAHTQAITDGRARVIVVLYGDVDMSQLDPELKMYLKTNTYVKWGDSFFWNKLKYALPHHKRNVSIVNPPHINRRFANIAIRIDDGVKLFDPVTVSPGSTPPVINLDPTLLKKHPLHFVPRSELVTQPVEAEAFLTTANT